MKTIRLWVFCVSAVLLICLCSCGILRTVKENPRPGIETTPLTECLEFPEQTEINSIVVPMVDESRTLLYDLRIGILKTISAGALNRPAKLFRDAEMMVEADLPEPLWQFHSTLYANSGLQNTAGLKGNCPLEPFSVNSAMEALQQAEVLNCWKSHPGQSDLARYGLTENVYALSFRYDPEVLNGGSAEENWSDNLLLISAKTASGTYYVYSSFCDAIVEVAEQDLPFVEWEAWNWYSPYLFLYNIAYVRSISCSIDGQTYEFDLDNRLSYAYYDNGDGTGTVIHLKNGTLTESGEDLYYAGNGTDIRRKVIFMDFEKGTVEIDADWNYVYLSETGVRVPFTAPDSGNLRITSPQYIGGNGSHRLDYLIHANGKTVTAVDNFRKLYMQLLWFSAQEANWGDDIPSGLSNCTPRAEIRCSMEDMASVLNPDCYRENNRLEIVIRLYRYTEDKLLLCIEYPTRPDEQCVLFTPSGNFYVLTGQVQEFFRSIPAFLQGELLE